ncbi:MAG: branched chain amino acid aminotransferase [Candidatus Diapherotrites archaeon CG11_big_fil_rev_8_21_14_0_20_37_9]|nr:MAG: branched chain amino acid aminotransferase [Candidatus Diapherotrites archaeon CG11_big_fil_rev_8_21_14_0_20_37_9]
MEETKFIWMNGKMVPWKEATVHVLTHTLHYGTGVFEGIRCYDTKDGSAIFRLKEHAKRLLDSAHIMQMKVPFTQEQIESACRQIVKENNLKECYIRPLVYFGYGQMGLATKGCKVDVSVAAWPWGSYLGEDGIKNGIRVKVSSFTRHHVNVMPTKSKTVGNYANSTLAKMEALNSGYEEAIMLDAQGYISECSGENIFIVRDNEIITPPTTNALEGITRKSIIEVAKSFGYTVKEELFTRDQLYISDEAFLTGTAAEVTPIREVDNRTIGNGMPGPITKKFQSTYFDAIHGKVPEYKKWLDFVK